ncbi:caspase family protein [Roseobacteraceae bacterium S113]
MTASFLFVECGRINDRSGNAMPEKDLPLAIHDVVKLVRFAEGKFNDRNIDIAVTDASLCKEPGHSLSLRSNLFELLVQFRDRSLEDDLRVFYFAGHGTTEDGELYLIPPDYKQGLTKETAIPLSTVMKAIQSSKGQTLVVLDCCRQNSQIEVFPSLQNFSVFLDTNTHVLLGCSQGQACHEIEAPRIKGGIFTHSLLQCLSECSVNDSLSDIYERLICLQGELMKELVGNRTQKAQIYSLSADVFFPAKLYDS